MATGRIGTTPVLQVRWSKAPSDGTTSLSGLDDNSVSLVYSVGYEAVYRNGVLLSRGNDYTATDGTTVTLIDATITGDIIEIFANQTIPLSDTYSQTVSDGKFINNTLTTTTGDIIYASGANTPARLAIGTSADVLTVSGGIPAWAAPAGGSFAGCSLLKSAAQSVSNATWTAISWDLENYDTDAFHDNSTNNTRITIPAGKGGKYLIASNLYNPSNSTGSRLIKIQKNGADIALGDWQRANSGHSTSTIFSQVLDLAVADYIEVNLYQDSGGALDVNFSIESTFTASYLGA
jgi:frataxin-like iron-binding protein CyaY